MRFLLDTQVWLWLHLAPERLNPEVLELITPTEHTLYLSSVSVAEISIKWSLGKLELPESPKDYVPRRMRESAIRRLTLTQEHALRIAELPLHHRDPFDRLLVAQAKVEGLELVTADATLPRYDVPIRWAGRSGG